MSQFEIVGRKKLEGSIRVAGSKNAALPLICASLLTKEKSRLTNVPDITDIDILIEMIEQLGAKVKRTGATLEINPSKVKPAIIKPEFFTKLRASILLLGPLVGRFGHANLSYPGGCVIGRRPINTHLKAVEDLGGNINENDDTFGVELGEIKNSVLYLKEASVTGTENVLMLTASRSAKTIIEFAACEPHIQTLCQALEQMGAKIKGIGSNRIEIEGSEELKGFDIRVNADEIETGTFIALGAASQSPLKITGIDLKYLMPILSQIDEMGVNYELGKDFIQLKPPFELKAVDLKTQPWPAFPTDLQPPFAVLATQSKGTTLIHETIFDQRLFFIDKLISMGADITLCDPHRAVIVGPTQLTRGILPSPDIRAGIALVIAALIANGKSTIDNVELIDRGYQNIVKRLKGIGADIKRKNSE